MGKYSLKSLISTAKEKDFLEVIANELAEMNRLKRLELREKYGHSDWQKDMQEDKA